MKIDLFFACIKKSIIFVSYYLVIRILISELWIANIQLILILWKKVRQTRIFAIVRVFPYYEEAKKTKKMNFFKEMKAIMIMEGILFMNM